MELDLNKDSRYYENMFNGLYPWLKNIEKEDIEKVLTNIIDNLQKIYKKLEIEYSLQGNYIVFNIKRVNTYNFDFNCSYDLIGFALTKENIESWKNYLTQKIKYAILEKWDSKILV